MVIEAMVRWTEMRLKKRDDQEAYLNRLVNGDPESDIPEAEFHYELSPMVFDMDDVLRYNLGTDPNFTILRMKDGDGFMVQIPYEKFKQLWVECTGRSILSVMNLLDDDEEETKDKEDDLIV
jgi:hypothetical protein